MIRKVDCIVLAAGRARRFGASKMLARIGQETLIRRALRKTSLSSASRIHVVLGHDADRVEQEIDGACENIVWNARFQDGIGTSIAAGIRSLPADSDAALLVLGDQPLLDHGHLDSMIHRWHKNRTRIIASEYADTLGPPVLFPRSRFQDLMLLRGDEGARVLLKDGKSDVITVATRQPFVDIDRPGDLALAQQHAVPVK